MCVVRRPDSDRRALASVLDNGDAPLWASSSECEVIDAMLGEDIVGAVVDLNGTDVAAEITGVR